jgi:hypothetical protein
MFWKREFCSQFERSCIQPETDEIRESLEKDEGDRVHDGRIQFESGLFALRSGGTVDRLQIGTEFAFRSKMYGKILSNDMES